jgi:hypothetical protein
MRLAGGRHGKPLQHGRGSETESQTQVVSILGKPTALENSVTTYFTLFYRGSVPGSGFVSGNVKLVDDRVYEVNKPVF